MNESIPDPSAPKWLYQAALEAKRGGLITLTIAHIAYDGHTLCGADAHTYSRGMSLEGAQTWYLASGSHHCTECKNAARDERGSYREARAAYEYQRARMLDGRPHLTRHVTQLRETLERYYAAPDVARDAAEQENTQHDAGNLMRRAVSIVVSNARSVMQLTGHTAPDSLNHAAGVVQDMAADAVKRHGEYAGEMTGEQLEDLVIAGSAARDILDGTTTRPSVGNVRAYALAQLTS